MLLETRSKLKKMFWLAVLLMLVMCVVATQSRGGTVALASIGLYFWWKSPRKVLTASLVVLVVATIFLWAPREYFDRMGMIADTQEGSAQGRIIAWTAGVKMAMANPILGAGAGNFTYAYGDFYRVEDTPLLTAHSIYFLLLGELGLPGLILLLTFIFSNLAANRQLMRELSQLPKGQGTTARNALACTSAALVAYATGGAFLSAAYYPHMYVLSGLLVAARHIVRVQLEQREHAPVDERALEARRARLALRPDGISPEWRPRPALMTGRLEESVD
jgi:probable O-glycosylation ligase (exosortase A-associated)